MIKCSEDGYDCFPICDFCKYYNFNADDKGRYTGDGYCTKHSKPQDPSDDCNDFHCSEAIDLPLP